MEKINLHNTENQTPQAGIRFLLTKLLPPNFKNLNKALHKRVLFLPERKYVLTGMKNSLKNLFPLDEKLLNNI